MESEQSASKTVSREKLGLALSGGGFRASLFHVGVLRRMAELDLLRRVEVLSTVSGGSIVGALYVLLLKEALEACEEKELSRDDYVDIVADVKDALVDGIEKNPRTRLFMNPLGVLRVLLTEKSLGRRMARLYERHLYADVVKEIIERSVDLDHGRPGRLPLRELRIRPGDEDMEGGSETYNAEAVEEGKSASTKIVINAASLNSGARFWFSSSEVGDWYLGHVRHSEIDKLKERKRWLGSSPEQLEDRWEETRGRLEPVEREYERARTTELLRQVDPLRSRARALSLAHWWITAGKPDRGRGKAPDETAEGGLLGDHWRPLFDVDAFPGRLLDTDLGLLRQAQVSAWYLTEGSSRLREEEETTVSGGRDPRTYWHFVWDALERIDPELEDALQTASERSGRAGEVIGSLLPEFLLELYALRTAEFVSSKVEGFWCGEKPVSVGDAVGASANFPPVFPPFVLLGLYDDLHVSRLGLTDGGVFDNMGITALVDEGCTQIVASDTSGVFEDVERASTGRLKMMTRIGSILQKVVASLQREGLRERRRVSRKIEPHADEDFKEWGEFLDPRRLTDLAYFHIDSWPVDPKDAYDPDDEDVPELTDEEVAKLYPDAPPAYDEERRRALAHLRTDLDAFSTVEMKALINHGYGMADRYVRRYFTPQWEPGSLWNEKFWGDESPPECPEPIGVRPDVLDYVLRVGGARFFRALRVGAVRTWLFVVAALVGLVWWTWDVSFSLRGAVRRGADWLGDASVSLVYGIVPWIADVELSLGATLLGLVLLQFLLPRVTGFSLVEWLKTNRDLPKVARRVATIGKWGRSWIGMATWLFGAFPLALSAVSSVAAAVSHFFFSRPYVQATRDATGTLLARIFESREKLRRRFG